MNIVTGAFGYIGKYIAKQLLKNGEQVKTITTHTDKPNQFGDRLKAIPYNFDRPAYLVESLKGARTLYNTYWIRFEFGGVTFQQAINNTKILFECAKKAGIEKIVHISVTNASKDSPLPYYRGKAFQEQALIDSGVSYSIVRPTLVFGKEDILVNNIAWLIRKFPFFPIFGNGKYRLQPVYVGDLADISINSASNNKSEITDAIGPEIFKFRDFVKLIASKIKPGIKLVNMPPSTGIAFGKIIGLAVKDVILTKDELRGLMDEMLTSNQAPNGKTAFTDWLEMHKDEIGASYSSEIDRHFKWKPV